MGSVYLKKVQRPFKPAPSSWGRCNLPPSRKGRGTEKAGQSARGSGRAPSMFSHNFFFFIVHSGAIYSMPREFRVMGLVEASHR